MRSWRRAATSIAFGLVVTEVLLRAALYTTPLVSSLGHDLGPAARRLGWYYRSRTHDAEVNPLFEHDPHTGWRPMPGVSMAASDGFTWQHTVTAEGARAPTPASPARRPGVQRLLVVGDSFGFGWDVDDQDAWHARLQQARPDWEVVNLSVGGFDPGQALLRYRQHRDRWQPDVVMLAHNVAMVRRVRQEFDVYVRPLFDPRDGAFAPQPVPTPVDVSWEMATRPQLLELLAMARFAWWSNGTSQLAADEAFAQAIVDRFVREVADDGRRPVVMWMSGVVRTPTGFAQDSPRCASDPAVPCIVLAPALATVSAAGHAILRGTHYSPEASQAIATEVAQRLDSIAHAP